MKNTCAHCFEKQAVPGSSICESCQEIRRCEVCEVFLDGICKPSEEYPDRCDSCLDYEALIKFNCFICTTPITIYYRRSKVLNYVVRGNCCGKCNSEAEEASKISRKVEHTGQFIGYLAMAELMYNQGVIDQGQFEYAVRMNPHDVIRWDGFERIKEDIEREEAEEEDYDIMDAYD